MTQENGNRREKLTLRDVALAALELDASGGRGSVSWRDIVAKANALAGDRAKTPSAEPASKEDSRG